MHQKLAELDRNWSFLKCGHSFRENWIFWFTPSRNFSMKIKSMWVTYESYQRILFPEEATTCWFWGIRISYLRYVNYLQSGLHQDKYRTLAVKNFQIWSLTLDPIQSSTIWTYEPLPTYGHLLVESHHSNVRKTLLWLFATLLCWFRTTKYLVRKCYLRFYSSHQVGTYIL